MRYSEAKVNGEFQRKVMDEVMQKPEIKTNWKKLDFRQIINRLHEMRAT